MYDVIIVGAGPAGMTAAIYLARKKMNILLLTDELGGQTAKAATVENYPGFLSIQGSDLIFKMKEQVDELKVENKMLKVDKIVKKETGFSVITGDPSASLGTGESFEGKSVIVAAGKTPRPLNVPGEEEYLGKGIGYCVTCDGPLFRDKKVAVIGGGNSVLDAALEMEKYASMVYIVNLNPTFQGDEVRVDKVEASEKIKVLNQAKTVGFYGEKLLHGLKYQDLKTNEEKELAVDGAFIEIGWMPATDMVADLVELNNLKEIEVDQNTVTSCEGVFAAGDVTNGLNKQIIIAAGQGATAAMSAWKYVITHK